MNLQDIMFRAVAILVLFFGVAQAVELKGYEIGSEYTGHMYTRETIGNINGTFVVDTLNDNRICMVSWISDNISNSAEITNIISGIETKYGVSLTFYPDNSHGDMDGTYKAIKDGFMYSVVVDYNKYGRNNCGIMVFINDIGLTQIFAADKQAFAKTDF